MNPKSINEIISYSFNIFSGLTLEAEVISRNGGASPEPWKSLNLGGTVGDDPGNVKLNKDKVIQAFNLNPDRIYDVWQVHSADWVHARNGRRPTEPHIKADIIITDEIDLALLMRFADCVPIFIYDLKVKAIGIAHAGWQGTAKNVSAELVKAMSKTFGSNPANLLAAIGPAICISHYPVGIEVIEALQESLGPEMDIVSEFRNGTYTLDLKKCNEIQLIKSGVIKVENSNICTVCDNENWFSHRYEKGKTGRFGAFIRLIK